VTEQQSRRPSSDCSHRTKPAARSSLPVLSSRGSSPRGKRGAAALPGIVRSRRVSRLADSVVASKRLADPRRDPRPLAEGSDRRRQANDRAVRTAQSQSPNLGRRLTRSARLLSRSRLRRPGDRNGDKALAPIAFAVPSPRLQRALWRHRSGPASARPDDRNATNALVSAHQTARSPSPRRSRQTRSRRDDCFAARAALGGHYRFRSANGESGCLAWRLLERQTGSLAPAGAEPDVVTEMHQERQRRMADWGRRFSREAVVVGCLQRSCARVSRALLA
jgi:hypothetical protein